MIKNTLMNCNAKRCTVSSQWRQEYDYAQEELDNAYENLGYNQTIPSGVAQGVGVCHDLLGNRSGSPFGILLCEISV